MVVRQEKLIYSSRCKSGPDKVGVPGVDDSPREHLEAYAAAVEHDLNHQRRPCLNGNNASRVYFTGKQTFTKWDRRDAYAWILNPQDDIVCSKGVQQQAAWRIAVEAWMKKKGFITITVVQIDNCIIT